MTDTNTATPAAGASPAAATLEDMLTNIHESLFATMNAVDHAQRRYDSVLDAFEAMERRAADAEAKARQLEADLLNAPAPTKQDAAPTLSPFASAITADDEALDAILWRHTPTLITPIHSAFVPLPIGMVGHRYLVAADGLWLECRRPWLYLLWPVSKLSYSIEVPAGRLTRKVEIAFGKVPHHMIREFAEHGRRNEEREIGSWASWVKGHPGDAHLEWADDRIFMGTESSLEYERPAFTETECPCLDFHTHGTAPAGFSGTDNADDAHDVKIAIVIGDLNKAIPSIAARLCCLGLMLPIAVDANEVFGVAE